VPHGATFHFSVSDQPIRAGGARAASDYIGRRGKHLAHDGDPTAGGLVASGLVGWPDGQDGDAARDMWAAAEAAEQPKRARPDLAAKRAAAGVEPREKVIGHRLILALPSSLDDTARARLLNGFALHIRDQHQLGVEWAHHRGDRARLNDHGHVNVSGRELGADGTFGRKSRAFSHDKTPTGIRSSDTISALRLEWERRVNRELERAGQAVRVDSRSLRTAALEDATGSARRARVRVPPAAYARAQEATARQASTNIRKPARRPSTDPRSIYQRHRIRPPYLNNQRDAEALAKVAARDAAHGAAIREQTLRTEALRVMQEVEHLRKDVIFWERIRVLAQKMAQKIRQGVQEKGRLQR